MDVIKYAAWIDVDFDGISVSKPKPVRQFLHRHKHGRDFQDPWVIVGTDDEELIDENTADGIYVVIWELGFDDMPQLLIIASAYDDEHARRQIQITVNDWALRLADNVRIQD